MISLLRTRTSRHSRWLCLLAVATLVGCTGTKERDVLESRLRHQEDMLASYQSQLDRAKTELDVARRESASLRQQLADADTAVAPTEHVDASFRATGIEFSPFMTGGTNINSSPGDEGLTVVLLPKDPDGAVVKVAGTIEIEAFDLARPEGAQRIGYWKYAPSECHEYWHQGVIQSGYQFELPWQEQPQAEKVLLHGRLVAIDGRQFDTTHTITIDPPGGTTTGGSQTAGTQESPITQLSGFDDGQSTVQPAHAESFSTAWEDQPKVPAPATAKLPEDFDPTEFVGPNPFGHSGQTRPQVSDARAMTGTEFKQQLDATSPLSVGQAVVPRRAMTDASMPKSTPFAKSSPVSTGTPVNTRSGHEPPPFPDELPDLSDVAREIPPPIQDAPEASDDWWDADDWPHETQRPATQTSDSWTDETIPYLR
ncbi:MAG: hypothetical protein R3B91_09235 [Planctomycetaceae bacterium]